MTSKDVDYQLALIMRLYKIDMPVSKDAKLAFYRTASSAISFFAFLATQKAAKKTVCIDQLKDVLKELSIPGLADAAEKFISEQAAQAKAHSDAKTETDAGGDTETGKAEIEAPEDTEDPDEQQPVNEV